VEPLIEVRDLSYRFPGAPDDALSHVDLRVAPGEFVVITGPSGCGKSTLALAITGFLFGRHEGHAEGTVAVAGMDVRDTPLYDVAERVGLVQQNPENQFCTLTVADELAFGLENRRLTPDLIRRRIDWAAGIVGAAHLLGRSLGTLSGGEKQRIAVAAMMAAKPDVLIFDEPTASLDPTATAAVFEVIDRIRARADIAVIVIEHKLEYLERHDPRLVVLEEGRIVHDGPPDDDHPLDPPWGSRQSTGRADPRGEPCVEVAGLTLEQQGHPVIEGLDLTVRGGELVALMGDTGAGKSSLLMALTGLLGPAAGAVKVAGIDTRSVRVSRLARELGFVWQNPDHQIVADTVRGELQFGPRAMSRLDEARIGELLARLDLSDRAADHPYRLSHGQKRRLNLASALAHGPALLLLDELLVGQDPARADQLMGLVRQHVDLGGAAVAAMHDAQRVWRWADRLVFLEEGRVAADAPVEEAFALLTERGRRGFVVPANGEAS